MAHWGQQTGYQYPLQTGYQQPNPQFQHNPQFQQQNPQFQQQNPQFQQQGFAQGGLAPQQTGFLAQRPQRVQKPQQTGFLAQRPQRLQKPQQTGFVGGGSGFLQQQPTGFVPVPPILSQFQQQPQNVGGGFLNVAQQPQQTNRFLSPLTKAEKKSYDNTFRAWDTQNTGFISGQTALEVFRQSGLGEDDLARIWTLADRDDRGKLNVAEFRVAMGLIYRRLDGNPIPDEFPEALVETVGLRRWLEKWMGRRKRVVR